MSPSPSPDELVIQQRGRRKLPVTFSPDIDQNKRQMAQTHRDRTPVKNSPGKSQIVLRSTPRKRLLLLTDPKELCSSPEKKKVKIHTIVCSGINKPVTFYLTIYKQGKSTTRLYGHFYLSYKKFLTLFFITQNQIVMDLEITFRILVVAIEREKLEEERHLGNMEWRCPGTF